MAEKVRCFDAYIRQRERREKKVSRLIVMRVNVLCDWWWWWRMGLVVSRAELHTRAIKGRCKSNFASKMQKENTRQQRIHKHTSEFTNFSFHISNVRPTRERKRRGESLTLRRFIKSYVIFIVNLFVFFFVR